MKKSCSKEFIRTRVKLSEGVGDMLAGAERFLGANANLIGLGSVAIPGAIAGMTAIYDSIKQKMLQYKWAKQGCDREIDPNRKIQCEIRARNILMSNLAKEKGNCRKQQNPVACVAKIDERINSLKSQNAQEYGDA